MKKFFAFLIICAVVLSMCSCAKIVVNVVVDEPPAVEAVVTLPPATEPATEPPAAPATEPSAAPNVNTGEL